MFAKPALLHFKFDNFAHLCNGLCSNTGCYVFSEYQTDCNGNVWRLQLYPNGRSIDEGFVSLYLCSGNKHIITCSFDLSINSAGIACKEKVGGEFQTFDPIYPKWGLGKFHQRSEILDTAKNLLKNGALCIDASIQVKQNKDDLYHPPSSHAPKKLHLLKSGEKADVSFTVGTKKFLGHEAIIYGNSPILANYCTRLSSSLEEEEIDSEKVIKGISPKAFQFILEYIYSGCIPSDDYTVHNGKELINFANKVELVELKMAIENILVQECILTKENVSSYILFADAHSCPLLKEYAISYFLLHYKEVLKSEHSSQLRDSGEILSEIMLSMGGEDDRILCVTELRKELGKLGLDTDGSKEALVLRFQDAQRQMTGQDNGVQRRMTG